MRAFTCPVCRHLVTFESIECLHCGTALGFDWDARETAAAGETPPASSASPPPRPPSGASCSSCSSWASRSTACERHVSAYATMHPWEDWAETFAHYLHIRDVLQTATAYGLTVAGPRAADAAPLHADPAVGDWLDAWLPLTYALDAISRSLGDGDLYPFVLAPAVIAKLALVDELVRAA